MKPFNPSSKEDNIINMLAIESLSAKEILEKLNDLEKITKQALYKILNRLIFQEILVKHNQKYSLSRIWIQSMSDFILKTESLYGLNSEKIDFLNIKEGDKIEYSFKNAVDADKFWGHAFDLFTDTIPKNQEITIYNQHQWFLIVRKDEELMLFDKIKKQEKYLKNYVSGKNFLDEYVRQYFDQERVKYETLSNPPFEANNYYVNIFGTKLIEVYLDEKTSEKLTYLYQNTHEFKDSIPEKIKKIASEGKTRIIISNSPKKAKYILKEIENSKNL